MRLTLLSILALQFNVTITGCLPKSDKWHIYNFFTLYHTWRRQNESAGNKEWPGTFLLCKTASKPVEFEVMLKRITGVWMNTQNERTWDAFGDKNRDRRKFTAYLKTTLFEINSFQVAFFCYWICLLNCLFCYESKTNKKLSFVLFIVFGLLSPAQ